jgi:Domain of unknown function (DUF4258)
VKKSPKAKNLENITSKAAADGFVLYSKHANERMLQRGIIKPEVEYVLMNGRHEVKKDQFNKLYSTWDYAIKGKTVDGRNLRIIVTLVEPNVLVVTTIDLDQ